MKKDQLMNQLTEELRLKLNLLESLPKYEKYNFLLNSEFSKY